MIHRVVTRVSFDSFRQRSEGRRVVLMYPWTNYRNLFLSHFLASAKDGLLYYRIPHDTTNLAEWVTGLVNELDLVLGGFGKKTRPALEKDDPVAIGTALAADLGAYSRDPIVLYLDELDRVPHDDAFRSFAASLVSALADHVQIAISSRLLTYRPWYDMVAQGEAIVLGVEHRRNDVMFTLEEQPKPQLEVYALGRGHAIVNGQQITNWDGALPRNLFFYFLDHPLVTRDEIFAVFWPRLNVKEATNVYHVTKRKISERISMKVMEPGNYELTRYGNGFYMPSEKIVRHYDVFDFQDAVEQAMVAEDDHREELLYRRAIDLYKAPYLEPLTLPWIVERRDQLRQLYAQALIGMGRIYKTRKNPEKALGFFTRSLREMPEREDVHREVMALYLQLGMVRDAQNQFQLVSKILKDSLKIKPSRETRELYKQVESQL